MATRLRHRFLQIIQRLRDLPKGRVYFNDTLKVHTTSAGTQYVEIADLIFPTDAELEARLRELIKENHPEILLPD